MFRSDSYAEGLLSLAASGSDEKRANCLLKFAKNAEDGCHERASRTSTKMTGFIRLFGVIR